MPEAGFIYYVYFDKVGRPERVWAKTLMDFLEQLRQMTERAGEMPEWIQRVYR